MSKGTAPSLPSSSAVARAANVPVSVVARHVHLSAGHLQALFGDGVALRPLVALSQPGEFASALTVEVRGPTGVLAHARVVGPVRTRTVVELPTRDYARIGLPAPQRPTSKIDGSPGCVLAGPKGSVVLAEGVLPAGRHLHLTPADARALDLVEDSLVAVHVAGDRARLLRDVPLRIREGARLELSVDLDEANSLDLSPGTTASLQLVGRPAGG